VRPSAPIRPVTVLLDWIRPRYSTFCLSIRNFGAVRATIAALMLPIFMAQLLIPLEARQASPVWRLPSPGGQAPITQAGAAGSPETAYSLGNTSFQLSPAPMAVAPPVITAFTAAKGSITAGTSTTLTATFTGGTATIDNGVGSVTNGTRVTISPAATTTFTLTVTNSLGVTATQTVTVTVDAAPVISSFTAAQAAITAGSSTTLMGAFLGGTGSIDKGVGAVTSGLPATVSPTATTSYTLTVTTPLGATVTQTATVTVVAAPVIKAFTVAKSSLTAGSSTTLNTTFTGGTATIDNGVGSVTSGTGVTITPAATTTFTLTVTNSLGIAATQTVTVTVDAAPVISSFTATQAAITAGSSTTLMGAFLGGTGSIDKGVGAVTSGSPATVSPTATTSYSLTVTNPLGATVAQTATVTVVAAPVIRAFTVAKSSLTAGSSTTLTATYTGGTATVDNGVGSVTSGTGVTITPTATTTFTLTVTNSLGASTTQKVTVTVDVAPVIFSFTAAQSSITAGSSTTLVGAFLGGTGSIDKGVGAVASGSPATVSPTATTAYTLTVANALGAKVSGTATVTVEAVPVIKTFTAAKAAITYGSSTTLNATFTGGTATIDNGVGSVTSGKATTINPAATTTYTLTITNALGVMATQSLTVTVDADPAIASFMASQPTITKGSSTTLTGVFSGGTGSINQGVGSVTSNSAAMVSPTVSTTYTLTVTNPLAAKATRTVSVTVVAVPVLKTFTAAEASITYGNSTTLTAKFTGGTASIDNGVGSVTSGQAVMVSPVVTTTYTLTLTNAAGTSIVQSLTVTVAAVPVAPAILAPAYVTANQAGYSASVPLQVGCTYAWTIANGSITAGTTTPSITFTAGTAGTLTLTCTVINAAGLASAPGTLSASIVPAPSTPVITAPTLVTANQAGYTASVPPQPGCTFAWTLTGGTITNGANTPNLTFTAGNPGALTLVCTATNAAGLASSPGNLSAAIVAAPTTPVIMAPATVTANQAGYTASVSLQSGCTVVWAITGGVITAGATAASMTFTAGNPGTLILGCTVTNAAGISASQTVTVTISATSAPLAITAPSTVVAGQTNYGAAVPVQSASSYAWAITGGTFTSDPTGNPVTFAPGPLDNPREFHTATVLSDGRIMLVGGVNDLNGDLEPTAAIFTPATATFSQTTGTPISPRYYHSATLLPNGQVLLAGGIGGPAGILAAGESFDPPSGLFLASGALGIPRYNHTATLLQTGQVLVTGGIDAWNNTQGSAELFNPQAQSFSPSNGTLATPRTQHTATLLPNGQVLLAGGLDPNGNSLASAEIYDPPSDQFLTAPAAMNSSRYGHTATVLPNGQVLLVGGYGQDYYQGVGSAELYDPPSGMFFYVGGPMSTPRVFHTATLLANGTVLITGGLNPLGTSVATGELFDPSTGLFTPVPTPMFTARASHTSSPLPSGQVLLAGGMNVNSYPVAIPELYDPVANLYEGTIGLTCSVQPTGGAVTQVQTQIIELPNPVPILYAPSWMTTGATYTATVPDPGYLSFAWSITNGTISSASNMASITFTSGSAGPLTLVCTTTPNTCCSPASRTGTFTATVEAPPAIISFLAGQASVVIGGSTTLTAVFTGGYGYVDNGIGTVASGVPMQVTPTANTTYTLYVYNDAGTPVTQQVMVTYMPQQPLMAAPTQVAANEGGFYASVQSQLGCTYVWQISGGTILAGAGTPAVVFASGASGSLVLTCTVTAGGSTSVSSTIQVSAGGPLVPVITAPQLVIAGMGGVTASVPPQAGCTLLWAIAGGALTSDPTASQVTFAAGALGTPRLSHTATLLGNGQVLLAGGQMDAQGDIAASADLFSPAQASVQPAMTPMANPRIWHTATLLANGQVLLAGGSDGIGQVLADADVFDPASGSFTDSQLEPNSGNGLMSTGRMGHGASLLQDGTVLLTGGYDPNGSMLATADVYQASTYSFNSALSGMICQRAYHTSTLLLDGRVLLAGGAPPYFGYPLTAELYVPGSGFSPAAGPMTSARLWHSATLLPSGQVLIIGGQDFENNTLGTAELFDPLSGTFTPTAGFLTYPRSNHTATLLTDGTVLVAGGFDANGNPLAAEEIFNSGTGLFTSAGGTMLAPRGLHTATLLPGGMVLMAGGQGLEVPVLASPEVWDPVAATFGGTLVLTCTATNVSGTTSSAATSRAFIIPALVAPVVTSGWSPSVTPGQTFVASVTNQLDASYAWTVVNGTIVSGGNGATVTVIAGSVGTVNLTCTQTDPLGNSISGGLSLSVLSTIVAPSLIRANQAGFTASVPALAGATYVWTIANGSIITGANSNSILFASGNPGNLVLDCVTSVGGNASENGPLTVTVVQNGNPISISAPSITFPGSPFNIATASWVGVGGDAWGVINGSIGNNYSNIANSIMFQAGASGTTILYFTSQDDSGVFSAGMTNVVLEGIVAPDVVTAGQSGYLASVPNLSNIESYWGLWPNWTISSGSIWWNGNPTYFTAGGIGTITISCELQYQSWLYGYDVTYCAFSKDITVIAAPVQPVLTGPSKVTAQTPGYTASCAAQPGCTFQWTLTNGTIMAGNGTNQVTFTPGTTGTSTLSCSAINATGSSSTPASLTIQVYPAPLANITALPALAYAGTTGLTASVPNQDQGTSYAWTIQGGTLTSDSGLPAIKYNPGGAGTVILTCQVTNAIGTSATGSLTVPLSLVPSAAIVAPASVWSGQTGLTAMVAPQAGATYAWTIAGGIITSTTIGNSIVFTAGAPGPLTLQCSVVNNGNSASGQQTIPVLSAPYYTYYSFDEGQGNLLLDHSGHGFTGLLQNNTQWVPGKEGTALAFDGASSYVAIPFVSPFQGPFSVSVWVNFGAVNKGTDNTILTLGTPIGLDSGQVVKDTGLVLYERGGFLNFDSINDTVTSQTPVQPNVWTHLAFVTDGTNRSIYINGVLDITQAAGSILGTGPTLTLAQEPWAPQNTLLGKLDELKIYDYALAPSDVALLYSEDVNVIIAPRIVTLAVGQSHSFTATVSGNANSALTWTLPDPNSGAITQSGVYTAPATIPAQGTTYRIIAQSQADPSQSDTAQVTINWPVRIAPQSVNLPANGSAAFQAVLTNQGDPGVTWAVQEANGGTITSAGVYTAPAQPGTYHVIASSTTTGQTSSATVLVGAPCATALNQALMGYWSFDTLGNLAADASGHGNDGILINGPVSGPGKVGNGLTFNGANSYVDLPTVDMFTGPFTISAWVKFAQVNRGTDNTILGHGVAGDWNRGLHLVERGGKPYFGFWGNDLQGNTPLQANQWTQIVATFDGSQKALYVNGVLDSTQTSSPYLGSGANAQLGRLPWGNLDTVLGTLDEVRIYTRAISAAEVGNLFSSTVNVFIAPHAIYMAEGASQAFTAQVTDSAHGGVNWSLPDGSASGTITTTGTYTAPAAIPANGMTYHVKAQSVTDPTQADVATVTIQPALRVEPSGPQVPVGGNQSFTALGPDGSTLTASWSVNESGGGTINSATGMSATYSAPATPGTYHVVASVNGSSVQATVTVTALPMGPIAYFPLNEGSGTIAYDASGFNTSVAMLQNGPAWVAGYNGTGLSFQNNAVATLVPPINLGSGWTVSAWILTPLAQTGFAHALVSGASGNDILAMVAGDQVSLGCWQASTNTFWDSGFRMNTLTDGWHLLTVTASGGVTNFFLDGATVGVPIPWQTLSSLAMLGNSGSSSEPFGTMDEFRIYGRALAAGEVATSFSAPTLGVTPSGATLPQGGTATFTAQGTGLALPVPHKLSLDMDRGIS